MATAFEKTSLPAGLVTMISTVPVAEGAPVSVPRIVAVCEPEYPLELVVTVNVTVDVLEVDVLEVDVLEVDVLLVVD
jgi:hypothetical protein